MSASSAPLPALDAIPPDIVSVADYERYAPKHMTAGALAYIAGGSGREQTLQENALAFDRVTILNRLLVDCRQGSTRLSLLGHTLRHPVLLAPVAYQKLVHPQGELATAHAAEALDALMVASTLASCSLEDIANSTSGDKWFQLYWQPAREVTLDLVRRAEAAGYTALMVTLDAPLQSGSRRARQAGFVLPKDVQAVNLQDYPAPAQVVLSPEQSIIFQGMMSEAPQWSDLEWLIRNTRLPVIVKGVLHPADAVRLQQCGVSGIVVSNHGGRSLDGVPASITVLPAIRAAVGHAFPLLLDSGVRSGSDVFKAIALGANAVMIGRPQVYALAVAGALGVAHLLRILRDELEFCMSLAGCPTIDSIGCHALYEPSQVEAK